MDKSEKIMVIGGAGAIGSYLVNKLHSNGVEALVVDNLSSGRLESINNKQGFVYCDISDKDKIQSIIAEFEPSYIFNLAAHFANQNSVDFPYEDVRTNIVGQLNVLEACKKLNNLKKYVYASSSCVYGNVELMTENSTIYPTETPYAINKFTAELYTNYYAELFGVPTVSVRIFNTFGEGELAGRYRNVIPNFIHNALLGKDICITGDGTETRDFTYVDDTVRCLELAATSVYCEGEVFNSGTGNKTNIRELVHMIVELTNSSSNVLNVPSRNWDDVKHRVSDTSKSISLLGYKPRFTVEEGLKKTVEWYKCQLS